ncbi:hypothetical protein J5V75_01025 [Akkermansia muciniphila]|jgi:hypothetical protein|uniref:hypothetical protein n=2 Tax=Akkermansia muciniphila TaxID=239935 RepID=UPI001C02E936|nr:hypothetical protein [Akkermansia muciniphila]MBT9541500.1 hypothetical protein [Akkermansia muciniphila]MBT9541632.1 hypothetical protein [Akkermansia muciniphila]DAF38077.1 MAG TPA: hypothetical protein [Caudoviricetes sp.]
MRAAENGRRQIPRLTINTTIMYSTNTNHQQDRGQQAPNVKPSPKGDHFVLHIEDVATDNDKLGLAIYWSAVRETAYETPAFRVFATLKEVINRNADAIGEIMDDAINRNREDKQ